MPKPSPLYSIRKLSRAWIQKDAEAMSYWLTDDITEIGPVFKSPLVGKKKFFASYHRKYLRGSLCIKSYQILQPRKVKLHSTLVLVHFRYRLKTIDRGVVEDSTGKESMLVAKEGNRWRVKFIHWHRDPHGNY
ncbi:MAG: nuclear transport factor 2 family protein [Terriglobia bacterium]